MNKVSYDWRPTDDWMTDAEYSHEIAMNEDFRIMQEREKLNREVILLNAEIDSLIAKLDKNWK